MPLTYRMRPLSDLFSGVEGIDSDAAQESFYNALDTYCQSQGRCQAPSNDIGLPNAATVHVKKTSTVGPNTGTYFTYQKTSPTMQVKKVLLKYGSNIDSIQLLLSDEVDYEYSPRFGGRGG